MGWRHHTEVGPDRTLHVWPETDEREHITEGSDVCWCAPQVNEANTGVVLIHHRDRLDRYFVKGE